MNFDEYYLEIANSVALKSKCKRSKVGYVVVSGDMKDIISTGYNGSAPGDVECSEGCPRARLTVDELARYSSYDNGPGLCIYTHAEMNALLRAGKQARGAVMYGTRKPCFNCMKHIKVMEVNRVVYLPEE